MENDPHDIKIGPVKCMPQLNKIVFDRFCIPRSAPSIILSRSYMALTNRRLMPIIFTCDCYRCGNANSPPGTSGNDGATSDLASVRSWPSPCDFTNRTTEISKPSIRSRFVATGSGIFPVYWKISPKSTFPTSPCGELCVHPGRWINRLYLESQELFFGSNCKFSRQFSRYLNETHVWL